MSCSTCVRVCVCGYVVGSLYRTYLPPQTGNELVSMPRSQVPPMRHWLLCTNLRWTRAHTIRTDIRRTYAFHMVKERPVLNATWWFIHVPTKPFTLVFTLTKMNPAYIVHSNINFNWITIDQLDVTYFIISLFTAQHVSNVSTSIFRSLRLIVDLSHGLYCSGSMCVGVTVWFGWGGVVSGCRLEA